MKKLISLLLAVFMLCSVASASEILFRDIPWGSNTLFVEKAVRGFAEGYVYTNDDTVLLYWSEDPFVDYFSAYTPYEAGWQVSAYTDKLDVAGYPVRYVDAYCHYGIKDGYLSHDKKDGQFYQAVYTFDVINIENTYSDLKTKLEQLYGLGKETVDEFSKVLYTNSDRIEYDVTQKVTIWTGDNGTSVMLCSSTSSRGIEKDLLNHVLSLKYGNTNANFTLEEVAYMIKNEHMIAEAKGAISNFDGL